MPKQVAEKHLTLVSLAGAATSRVPRPASLPANSLVATVLRQLPARQALSGEATPRRRGCAPPPVLAETMLRQLAASPRARSARAQAILARTAETGTFYGAEQPPAGFGTHNGCCDSTVRGRDDRGSLDVGWMADVLTSCRRQHAPKAWAHDCHHQRQTSVRRPSPPLVPHALPACSCTRRPCRCRSRSPSALPRRPSSQEHSRRLPPCRSRPGHNVTSADTGR